MDEAALSLAEHFQTLDLPPEAAGWLLDVWQLIQAWDDVADGDATTVRLTFRLVDDNRAQGLDTAFWLVFEARP